MGGNSADFIAAVNQKKRFHLVGIGGVSMRALAKMLLHLGCAVSGSDRDDSRYLEELKALGADVHIGHDAAHALGADILVLTAAVGDQNPEVAYALTQNIPVFVRAEAWGYIMGSSKTCVCIAGTHGKTSTTAMVASALSECQFDPTVMVGGDLPSIGGSLRIGRQDIFVAEACEYKNSFLSFIPTVAVILNIDRDHLDFFPETDDIISSFRRFALNTPPESGVVIANASDANTMKAVAGIDRKLITFSALGPADVTPANITRENGCYRCDVLYRGEFYARLELSLPGLHNLENALAACCVAIACGADPALFAQGLRKHTGVSRRFEYKGEYRKARIFDDYAHHPSEIEAVLQAARDMGYQRIVCVFQPHTYSRTVSLLDDFAKALSGADVCILSEIFAAREENTYGISSQMIADQMEHALYIPKLSDIATYLSTHIGEGDLVFTMGAGDVYKVYDLLVEGNEAERC